MSNTSEAGNDAAQFEEASEVVAPGVEDFLVQSPEPEKETAEDEEVEDESEEESEESSEEVEDEEEAEDEEGEVLSQEVDIESIPEDEKVAVANDLLDSLSAEQRKDFYIQAKGRVGEDMSKMRKRTAEAEHTAEAAEAKYEELKSKTFYADNPYSAITEEDKLDEELEKANGQIRAGRALLRTTDSEFEINGEYKSREWVDQQIDAYERMKDAIPRQRERLKEMQRAKKKLKATEEALSDKFGWFGDESSDEYGEYSKLMKDPSWSMAVDLVPSLAEKIPEVLAKFVSSGDAPAKKKAVKKKLPTRGKRKPKGDIGTGGASGNRSSGKRSKAKDQARDNIYSGKGGQADVVAMFSN